MATRPRLPFIVAGCVLSAVVFWLIATALGLIVESWERSQSEKVVSALVWATLMQAWSYWRHRSSAASPGQVADAS